MPDGRTRLGVRRLQPIAGVIPGLLALASVLSACTNIPKEAFEGNLDRVKLYLAERGDVNDRFRGMTLLHYAASGGQRHVAAYLIESGAEVSPLNESNLTPLHFACEHQQLEVADLLIQSGAKLDLRDHYGQTPLLYAAAGYDRSNVVAVDAFGNPIFAAREGADPRLVELLLDGGADPDIPTNKGNTPLHIAAYKGHLAVVKLLLSNGADPARRNQAGQTAQVLAEQFGKQEVADYLRDNTTP